MINKNGALFYRTSRNCEKLFKPIYRKIIGHRNRRFKRCFKKLFHKAAEKAGKYIGNNIPDKVAKQKPVIGENSKYAEEIIVSTDKIE